MHTSPRLRTTESEIEHDWPRQSARSFNNGPRNLLGACGGTLEPSGTFAVSRDQPSTLAVSRGP